MRNLKKLILFQEILISLFLLKPNTEVNSCKEKDLLTTLNTNVKVKNHRLNGVTIKDFDPIVIRIFDES